MLHKHAQKPFPINSQRFCQKKTKQFLMFWTFSALIHVHVCPNKLQSTQTPQHADVPLSSSITFHGIFVWRCGEIKISITFVKWGSDTLKVFKNCTWQPDHAYVTSPDLKLGRKEKNLQLTSPMISLLGILSLGMFGSK